MKFRGKKWKMNESWEKNCDDSKENSTWNLSEKYFRFEMKFHREKWIKLDLNNAPKLNIFRGKFIKKRKIKLIIKLIRQTIPVINPSRLKSCFSIEALESNRSYVHELNNNFWFVVWWMNERTWFRYFHWRNTLHLPCWLEGKSNQCAKC